jgi:hypothetical protein
MLNFPCLQSDLLLRIVARDNNVRWIACTSHCATVSDSIALCSYRVRVTVGILESCRNSKHSELHPHSNT